MSGFLGEHEQERCIVKRFAVQAEIAFSRGWQYNA